MCRYVKNYNYRKKKHIDVYLKMQNFKQNCNSTFSVTTRDRGQMAYFREKNQTHMAPTIFYDN